MKQTVLSIWLLSIFIAVLAVLPNKNSSAQVNIPEEVKRSFSKQYPDSYVYEWEWKKKVKLYQAEFMLKGKKHKAMFSENGDWVRTRSEIKKKDIPAPVLKSITQSIYAEWEIDDAEEHITPAHTLLYEIEMERGKQEVYLYFLPDGQLMETINKK